MQDNRNIYFPVPGFVSGHGLDCTNVLGAYLPSSNYAFSVWPERFFLPAFLPVFPCWLVPGSSSSWLNLFQCFAPFMPMAYCTPDTFLRLSHVRGCRSGNCHRSMRRIQKAVTLCFLPAVPRCFPSHAGPGKPAAGDKPLRRRSEPRHEPLPCKS